MNKRNWFDAGGDRYAQFRPTYPPALADYLADRARPNEFAVDVGCGNGQLTVQLAERFASVVGTDPSAEQLASATPHPRVQYVRASAEDLPVASGSAGLVTAAQAAHWFDLPRFYAEVRRVAAPGCLLALITYGRQQLDPDLDDRFQRFYRDEIGPFWPPERGHVDEGYRTLNFPFAEMETPQFEIVQRFDLPGLLGYLSTWSATRNAREAGRTDILERFTTDITQLWGDPNSQRSALWPISVRLAPVS